MDKLAHHGHLVTPLPTTGPQTAAAIARDCVAQQADLILAAGGDGTINEVANGLVGSDVPMAILPGGTANVLAMEMGMGGNMVRAAETLSSCIPERISVGRLEIDGGERYFLLMAGVGLDAHIVYHIDAGLKASLGKIAYWISGFGMVARMLPEFDTYIDGERVPTSFALATRVRNYGGDLNIAPTAHLLDRDFEFVLFRGRHAAVYLKYLSGVLFGGLSKIAGVTIQRGDTASFEHPADTRVYVQVDGEYAGHLPAKVSIIPSALTLLVPGKYRDLAQNSGHG